MFQLTTKKCELESNKLSNKCVLHRVEENGDLFFECCCKGNNCNSNLSFSMANITSLKIGSDLVDEVSSALVAQQGIFK